MSSWYLYILTAWSLWSDRIIMRLIFKSSMVYWVYDLCYETHWCRDLFMLRLTLNKFVTFIYTECMIVVIRHINIETHLYRDLFVVSAWHWYIRVRNRCNASHLWWDWYVMITTMSSWHLYIRTTMSSWHLYIRISHICDETDMWWVRVLDIYWVHYLCKSDTFVMRLMLNEFVNLIYTGWMIFDSFVMRLCF